jgi:hypothetical protein
MPHELGAPSAASAGTSVTALAVAQAGNTAPNAMRPPPPLLPPPVPHPPKGPPPLPPPQPPLRARGKGEKGAMTPPVVASKEEGEKGPLLLAAWRRASGGRVAMPTLREGRWNKSGTPESRALCTDASPALAAAARLLAPLAGPPAGAPHPLAAASCPPLGALPGPVLCLASPAPPCLLLLLSCALPVVQPLPSVSCTGTWLAAAVKGLTAAATCCPLPAAAAVPLLPPSLPLLLLLLSLAWVPTKTLAACCAAVDATVLGCAPSAASSALAPLAVSGSPATSLPAGGRGDRLGCAAPAAAARALPDPGLLPAASQPSPAPAGAAAAVGGVPAASPAALPSMVGRAGTSPGAPGRRMVACSA